MFETPFLKDHLLFSCGDHPGKISIVAYTNVSKCNLNCIDCHNKKTAKESGEVFSFLSIRDLNTKLKQGSMMGCDILVISGGEPTLDTENIIETIKRMKNQLPIRIDTNGQLPDEVVRLIEFCNGFAIDIKIPIKDEYSDEEKKRFSKILGINNCEKYRDNILRSIEIVDNMDLTLYRTVDYPLFSEDDKNQINNFVTNLKSPHYWNPYFSF